MVLDTPLILFTFANRALMLACVTLFCSTGSLSGQQPQPADPGIPVKLSDFRKLKFIEGNWRGTGYSKPFYESYRFLNDSTIESASYTDSTFTRKEPGGALIVYRGGRVYDEGQGGYRWALTRLDGGSFHFGPAARATNSFIW